MNNLRCYDYIYLVCYWEGSNRLQTIRNQWEFINTYPYLEGKTVLFVVNQRGKNPAVTEEIGKIFRSRKKRKGVKPTSLVYPNKGMLVGSLWDTYQWATQAGITAKYLFAVEDDWYFNCWPQREQLLEEGNVYVGMMAFSLDNMHRSEYLKWFRQGYKEAFTLDPDRQEILGAKNQRWTDGGCYFFKYKSLKEIEEKCGCFHRAMNRPFDYGLHGIDYGEVGFPTMLYGAGYKFTAYTGHQLIDHQGRVIPSFANRMSDPTPEEFELIRQSQQGLDDLVERLNKEDGLLPEPKKPSLRKLPPPQRVAVEKAPKSKKAFCTYFKDFVKKNKWGKVIFAFSNNKKLEDHVVNCDDCTQLLQEKRAQRGLG